MIAGLLVVAALLTGCTSSRELSAAASRIEPRMSWFWGYTYAGLEVDEENDRLIVYRKPDAGLDEAVRELAGDVEVEFRDAPYALDDLKPLVDRVYADATYWAEREVRVRFARTRPEGTGVMVVAETADLPGTQAAFVQRYDDRVTVQPPSTSGIVPA